MIPKPDSSLSVVVIPGTNSTLFLGPEINHLSNCDTEWVGENTGHIGRKGDDKSLNRFIRNFTNSPSKTDFIFQEII